MKKIIIFLSVLLSAKIIDCTICHNKKTPLGELNYLTYKEIITKLKKFKSGEGEMSMVMVAKKMSEKEMEIVAKAYAKKSK